ncbi:MAG: hypothetical protein AMXMBFR83_14110 [Phycisphaerae bacterium]
MPSSGPPVVNEPPKEYWQGVHAAARAQLPICASPAYSPDEHRLFTRFLDARGASFFEVGCAPGRWMAYFARYFDMKVSGIDYVEDAVALTRLNLQMQGIQGEVRVADFYQDEFPAEAYDVVYSRGFIEHVPDTAAVVRRIVNLARRPGGYVVTTVPNFRGLNGWLRKRLHPESYAAHVHLTPGQVREAHERAGVRTLFCGYCGVPVVIVRRPDGVSPPAWRGGLERRALWLVNGVCRRGFYRLGRVPRSRVFSPTIMYIGRRA